ERRFPDAGALARALAAGERPRERPYRVILALLVLASVGLGGVVLGASLVRPSAPPPPPPTSPPAPAAKPLPDGVPAWFAALPATERPALPLPVGLRFGARPGDY